MLGRLGLVIHWIGFIFGIIFACTSIWVLFLTQSVTNPYFGLYFIVTPPFFFLSINSLSWLIRYILAGSVPFMPWKEVEK